jgi:hypothetical protein
MNTESVAPMLKAASESGFSVGHSEGSANGMVLGVGLTAIIALALVCFLFKPVPHNPALDFKGTGL